MVNEQNYEDAWIRYFNISRHHISALFKAIKKCENGIMFMRLLWVMPAKKINKILWHKCHTNIRNELISEGVGMKENVNYIEISEMKIFVLFFSRCLWSFSIVNLES